MKTPLRKKALFGSSLGGFVALIAYLGWSSVNPDWFSSPTARRYPENWEVTLRNKHGRLNLAAFGVEPLPLPEEEWASDVPLPRATVRDEGKLIRFDWEEPLKEPTELYPANWLGGFDASHKPERELAGDGGKLRTMARATFFRTGRETWGGQVLGQNEGAIELDWQWLDSAVLEKTQLPPDFRQVDDRFHPEYITFHAILLKAEDVPAIEFFDLTLFDARTSRRIGMTANFFQFSERDGDWIRLTFAVGIQHETPVLLKMDFAAGTPVSERLPLLPNAEVVVNQSLRVRHLFSRAGNLYGNEADEISLEFEEAPGVQSFALVGPGTYTKRPLLVRHPATGTWSQTISGVYIGQQNTDDILFDAKVHLCRFTGLGETLPDSLEVGYLPYRQRLWFHFDDLGGMPGGAEVTDLFDVSIPYLPAGGRGYLSYMLELNSENKLNARKIYLAPRTYADTTPREILHQFVRDNPGVSVRVDQEEQSLIMTDRGPSFLKQIVEWAKNLKF